MHALGRDEVRSVLVGRKICKASPHFYTSYLRRWPASCMPPIVQGRHLVHVYTRVHPSVLVTDDDLQITAKKTLLRVFNLRKSKDSLFIYCYICGKKDKRYHKSPFSCRPCRIFLREIWCEVRCVTCKNLYIRRYCEQRWKVEHNDASYCSNICQGRQENNQGIARIPLCLVCNEKCKSIQNKYCSNRCQGLVKRIYLGKKFNCAFCDKPFIQKSSRRNKTCSKECARGLRIAGGYHAASRLSGRDYVFSYSGSAKRMMTMIRERDDNRCAMCLSTQNKRSIQVHHIDSDRENNSPENLLNLCKPCHTKAHYPKGHLEYQPSALQVKARQNNALMGKRLKAKVYEALLMEGKASLVRAKNNLAEIKKAVNHALMPHQAAGAISDSSNIA